MSSHTFSDDTPTNSTYKLVSSTKNEMILRDEGSSLDKPRTFRQSHQIAKATDGVDQHLVQLQRTDDDVDGAPHVGSVHTVIRNPREGVTSADLLLEWQKLKNYIDANWDDIVGGFLPSLS